MSAIASFVLVPKSALAELRDAAVPKSNWLGKPKDTYLAVLRGAGRETARYGWSGYVLRVGRRLPCCVRPREERPFRPPKSSRLRDSDLSHWLLMYAALGIPTGEPAL
jgi:hypothetical protein